MKYCPKERTSSGINARDWFCWRCGTILEYLGPCSCGRELSIHDHFCPDCGKEIKGREVQGDA